MELIDKLLHFGFTRQEALVYLALCTDGEMTGYETAKCTAISRSNAYTALAGLVEKGAAYVAEGNAARYSCVPFEEYSRNFIRRLDTLRREISEDFPKKKHPEVFDGYMTIRGRNHILDKILYMITETRYRLYICIPPQIMSLAEEELSILIRSGKKVVIFAPEGYTLEGAQIYHTKADPHQIRLIVDSSKVLTGLLYASDTESSTCLYSMNSNLVDVFKEMMRNEIILLEHGLDL